MTEKLYKVLLDGKSCHGSSMQWSLPTEAGPGDWHSVELPLRQCENGFHLTKDPSKWWKLGASCYEVEVGGQVLDYDKDNHKVCVEKVKLVRLLPNSELLSSFDLNVVTEGEHVVKTGLVYASGSASVRAFGSASVEAFDSASVRAFDSASVRAFDSASVRASGSASVEAFGSASVEAFGSASVRASGSASVEASGSASVEAFDSASVRAFDSASVRASGSASVRASGSALISVRGRYSNNVIVTLNESSVLVDYRNGKPITSTAS